MGGRPDLALFWAFQREGLPKGSSTSSSRMYVEPFEIFPTSYPLGFYPCDGLPLDSDSLSLIFAVSYLICQSFRNLSTEFIRSRSGI